LNNTEKRLIVLSKSIGAQIFLSRFFRLIEAGRVVFQPRNAPKTRQFLLERDLGTDDVLEVLRELNAEECVSDRRVTVMERRAM